MSIGFNTVKPVQTTSTAISETNKLDTAVNSTINNGSTILIEKPLIQSVDNLLNEYVDGIINKLEIQDGNTFEDFSEEFIGDIYTESYFELRNKVNKPSYFRDFKVLYISRFLSLLCLFIL